MWVANIHTCHILFQKCFNIMCTNTCNATKYSTKNKLWRKWARREMSKKGERKAKVLIWHSQCNVSSYTFSSMIHIWLYSSLNAQKISTISYVNYGIQEIKVNFFPEVRSLYKNWNYRKLLSHGSLKRYHDNAYIIKISHDAP